MDILTNLIFVLFLTSKDCVWAKTNIAYLKPTLSLTAWIRDSNCTYSAFKAVDGNYGNNLSLCQCYQCSFGSSRPNWWSVDFGDLYFVDYVAILNKNSLPQRLDYFMVGLSNDISTYNNPIRGAYQLCGQYPNKAQISAMLYVKCNPFLPKEKYLIVQQPVKSTGYLTICELEAYSADVYPGTPPIIWSKQFLDVPVMTYNVMLLDNVMYETKRSTALQCVVLCSVQPSKVCDSMNYCRSSGVCQLNSHKYGYNRSSIVNVSDATCFWMVPKYI